MECSICGELIVDRLEVITIISSGGVRVAHFYCFYPTGVPDRSLQLREPEYVELTRLSPERARFFFPTKPLF